MPPHWAQHTSKHDTNCQSLFGLGLQPVCSCPRSLGCHHYRRHRHIRLPGNEDNMEGYGTHDINPKCGETRKDKNHSILVRVQLRGVDDVGTVVLCVLVTITITGRKWASHQNHKHWLTSINPHSSSCFYLSMLSSHVSPTRSSSESDCRQTKQRILIRSVNWVSSFYPSFPLVPGWGWPHRGNCHTHPPPRHCLCPSGLGWELFGNCQEYFLSLQNKIKALSLRFQMAQTAAEFSRINHISRWQSLFEKKAKKFPVAFHPCSRFSMEKWFKRADRHDQTLNNPAPKSKT